MPLRCQGLTERQLEVVALAVDGLTIEQIAEALDISEPTAYEHVRNACRKMGVRTRAELRGVASPDEAPLIEEKPFLAAYLDEFDRWIRSGKADRRARNGMRIALWGAMNGE